MKAKQIIVGIALTVVGFLGGFAVYKHQRQVTYTETAVCKEKFPEFGETGLRGYIVIFEYDDGTVEEQTVSTKAYTHYQLNKRYIFTRTKYVWK